VSDFEPRLQQLLAERVDAELGPRRTPPRFEPSTATVYPVPTGLQAWVSHPVLLSLVAAACIVAILLGTVGLSHLSSTGPTPPAVNTPTDTSTPTPSATIQPIAPATGVAPTPGETVKFKGVTLVLPHGWVARPYSEYDATGGSFFDGGLCLTPASKPVDTSYFGCPVTFDAHDPDHQNTPEIDVDTEDGFIGDAAYCPDGNNKQQVVTSAVRAFGGRLADFRSWHITCPDGGKFWIEQYVVATGPGFILYSETVDPTIDADLAQIARAATLPAQVAPLRYFDVGLVRSAHQTSAGLAVRIDRVVPGSGPLGFVNNDPQTYAYLIPNSVLKAGTFRVTIGRLLFIYTDGHRVRAI
jgi:hypothetical protein